MSGGARSGEGDAAPRTASSLEWGVAAASALLVLGSAGFLLREAASTPPTPPRITLGIDSVVRTGEFYSVEFHARNDGGTTAAGLRIEGELSGDSGTVEKSETTLDYVPVQGKRGGGLLFTHDPRRGRLRLRPTGYDRP